MNYNLNQETPNSRGCIMYTSWCKARFLFNSFCLTKIYDLDARCFANDTVLYLDNCFTLMSLKLCPAPQALCEVNRSSSELHLGKKNKDSNH